jgi:hypothetical protein
MCYAASSVHPCGHAATRWSYCPESGMVGVGTTPPDCTEKTWGNASQTSARCPLVYCNFQAGSTWYVRAPVLFVVIVSGCMDVVGCSVPRHMIPTSTQLVDPSLWR